MRMAREDGNGRPKKPAMKAETSSRRTAEGSGGGEEVHWRPLNAPQR